jgi:hypothetical protein
MSQASDDQIGGAVFTGTVTNECVRGHLRVREPSQILIEQGLETKITADAFVLPATIPLQERDVLEVSGPLNHPNINQRFRIIGVADWMKHPQDRSRFIKLKLIRIERTRTEAKI